MPTAYQLRSSLAAGYQPAKPVRSGRYLAFIRKHASVVSGFGGCVAAHTGMHGVGQKASDLSCIPLTWKEHLEFDLDPKGFADFHLLDIPNLIEQFNELFKIEGGTY